MTLPDEARALATWIAEGVGLVHPPEGYPGATSMLLDEGGDVVLVDAGLPREVRRKLARHVDVLLLTHCHVAHAHGARDFREVWAPANEASALEGAKDFLETYQVSSRDADIVAGGIRSEGYEAGHVHKRYRPGGIIRLDKHEWHLLAAPGHSHDMVLLLEPKRHILFAADLDGERPPWYGLPSSDPSDLERTAMELVDVPVALLLSSHAAPRTRGIKPLYRQMGETIRERDRLVLGMLEKPRTLDELTDLGLLNGKPANPLARYHERVMVEKHLARLMEKDFAMARQDGRFQKV